VRSCIRGGTNTTFPYNNYSGYCSYAIVPVFGDGGKVLTSTEIQDSIYILESSGFTVAPPANLLDETVEKDSSALLEDEGELTK
jgi:hypothetical protein